MPNNIDHDLRDFLEHHRPLKDVDLMMGEDDHQFSEVPMQVVERDITEEISNVWQRHSMFNSINITQHANLETIVERVSVERTEDKKVIISTERRTLVITMEESWSSKPPVIITTTQVENLTYVVLAGDRCQTSDESSRFIFSTVDLADFFKQDVLQALSSKNFVKSDHLLSKYESEQITVQKKDCFKETKNWLSFVGYGLTVCGIVFVGAIAVSYGWRLAQGWF
jgi:hypothetical protein